VLELEWDLKRVMLTIPRISQLKKKPIPLPQIPLKLQHINLQLKHQLVPHLLLQNRLQLLKNVTLIL
jgi:hypothetical protein